MNFAVKNVYGKTSQKRVEVSVGGSKSVSARALIIAAIARGDSTLTGVQNSDDFLTFLNCLKNLGVKTATDGNTVTVCGCGGVLQCKTAEINVGSAGTAARFLPAFLAFQSGRFLLNCSEQMKKRPIKSLLIALERIGAKLEFPEKPYSYPFVIEGTRSPRNQIEVDINESSQFLSAVIIAASCAGYPVHIGADGSHGLDYVKMTVKMMKDFGVDITENDGVYAVNGCGTAREYAVEPDVSSACYFYAMNRILGTDITVKGVKPDGLQGDIKFIELLKNFNGGRVDMHAFSDQALTLAAIAPYFDKPTEIVNVAHIRGQECDRISAICHNLKKTGVRCEERADGVKIYPSQPKPAVIDTFGDHRVAMSFAVTGLRADGIIIKNAEVCSKTFADYFDVLTDIFTELVKNY